MPDLPGLTENIAQLRLLTKDDVEQQRTAIGKRSIEAKIIGQIAKQRSVTREDILEIYRNKADSPLAGVTPEIVIQSIQAKCQETGQIINIEPESDEENSPFVLKPKNIQDLDKIPESMLETHKLASQALESMSPFSKMHKVLRILLHQYWGVANSFIAEELRMDKKEISKIITTINNRLEEYDLRIVHRNGVRLLARTDSTKVEIVDPLAAQKKYISALTKEEQEDLKRAKKNTPTTTPTKHGFAESDAKEVPQTKIEEMHEIILRKILESTPISKAVPHLIGHYRGIEIDKVRRKAQTSRQAIENELQRFNEQDLKDTDYEIRIIAKIAIIAPKTGKIWIPETQKKPEVETQPITEERPSSRLSITLDTSAPVEKPKAQSQEITDLEARIAELKKQLESEKRSKTKMKKELVRKTAETIEVKRQLGQAFRRINELIAESVENEIISITSIDDPKPEEIGSSWEEIGSEILEQAHERVVELEERTTELEELLDANGIPRN